MKKNKTILTIFITILTFNLSANDKKELNMCYQEHKHHHELQNCDCKVREAKSCKVEDTFEKLIKKVQQKNKQ